MIFWGKTFYCYVLYSTPLHNAIFCKNDPVVKILLSHGKLNLEIKNSDGHTPLWLALQQVKAHLEDVESLDNSLSN